MNIKNNMNKNNSPRVSIIIVTHNSEIYIKNCISSVLESHLKSTEIIVVDNNSSDTTKNIIKEKFPCVTLVENSKNLGFSNANNIGIKKSNSEYILFLNPDTTLENNTLEVFENFMNENPAAAVCGPNILNSDGCFQPQSKRGFPTPLTSLMYFLKLHRIFPNSRIAGHYLLTYLSPEETHEVDAVSGSCMIVRKKALEEVGKFDEDYFLFGEDLDICYKLKQKGWKVYYLSDARLTHFGGRSTKRGSFTKTYHFYRSMYIFYRKNLTTEHMFFFNWLIYTGIFVIFILSVLFNINSYIPGKKTYAKQDREGR